MRNPEFRPLQEKTILNVLHHIRAEIVRSDLDGIEHADALLRARGVDPETQPVARVRNGEFRRNQLSTAVLRALRDGPKTTAEITALVSNRPNAARSVAVTLIRLRDQGWVRVVSPQRGRIRQVWGLTMGETC